jgi:hypothetical protein
LSQFYHISGAHSVNISSEELVKELYLGSLMVENIDDFVFILPFSVDLYLYFFGELLHLPSVDWNMSVRVINVRFIWNTAQNILDLA